MNKQRLIYIFFSAVFLLNSFSANSHAANMFFAPFVTCEVVNHLPHDMNAFTQGLLYHDGFFYESTGKHGRSSIRKICPENGLVRSEVKISSKLFGEGLCLWDGNLYQLTWRSGKCYIYDGQSLARKGVFNYKGQGWGLTTDGQFLFQSDGTSNITLRDPYDFKRISKLQVKDGPGKVHRINELEYIDGLIYCNIWQEDRIAAVDPLSGQVRFWIDISALRPQAGPEAEAANGIAWDRENARLYVTGKFWDKIFHIKLPGLARTIAARQLHE